MGHYTAFCKHSATGQWHYYNDSVLTEVSESDIVTEAAYVLFYKLRNF